jgi:C4-dicarboxylate-specific signal transduction histidine kinase
MPDDNAKPPAPKPHIANPFAKLTDEDWSEAMIRGQHVSDARDAATGAAIRRGCEKAIADARAELDKAQAALQSYLERASTEPEDLPLHRTLVTNLKNATDQLKNATDEYFHLVSNRPAH